MKYSAPWGWTKLEVYRGCPAQFKYKYMDKLPEPSSPALDRGSEIHGMLEQYVNGWSEKLPPINPFWLTHLFALRGNQPKTEASWGINKKWEPLKSWFEKDTWCRAKSDVFYFEGKNTLVLIDFKTGKYRVPSDDQIKLYATVGMSMFPYVDRVRTSFWFVDQAEAPHEQLYKTADLIKMRGYFNKAVTPIYKDGTFKPKPGASCRYCAFSRQKNGPCKY